MANKFRIAPNGAIGLSEKSPNAHRIARLFEKGYIRVAETQI